MPAVHQLWSERAVPRLRSPPALFIHGGLAARRVKVYDAVCRTRAGPGPAENPQHSLPPDPAPNRSRARCFPLSSGPNRRSPRPGGSSAKLTRAHLGRSPTPKRFSAGRLIRRKRPMGGRRRTDLLAYRGAVGFCKSAADRYKTLRPPRRRASVPDLPPADRLRSREFKCTPPESLTKP